MNNICITAEGLSKSFTILKRKITVLQVLLSLINRNSLKQTLWVLKDMSCVIKKGDRLALLGRNGSGKTTFLRILTSIYDATAGTFKVNGNARILFDSSVGFNAYISVIDNIYLLGAIHGIKRDVLKNEVQNILETTGLVTYQHALLKKLSMGQIQRLALSILFRSKSDLFIFDEALDAVDGDFIKTFDDHLKQLPVGDTTIIMTSHDSAFLRKYCTTAIWLEDGKNRMHGPFDEVNTAYERSFNT